jgi:hypothetical protein
LLANRDLEFSAVAVMEENKESPDTRRGTMTTRTMEIVVALVFLLCGGVVVFDSYRLGARWVDDGPQSGYFPFYIGLVICACSTVTLLQALFGEAAKSKEAFVERGQLKSVLWVLVPAALYVLGIQLIGIYLASTVYIAVFMVWLGKYSWFKGAALGLAASVGFFAMFEIWFKVPLPKGMFDPLGFLGY